MNNKPTIGSRERRAMGMMEPMNPDDMPMDGKPKKIAGYAAVFNSPTDIGGYFRERIAPGAFAKSIASDDVRALFNHEDCYVLGRTKNNTLALAEDSKGLRFEAMPPDVMWCNDLMTQIKRGDISQCSFQFVSRREEWDETGDVPLRTLLEVDLIDVSPVTFPAYADTSVGVRSLQEWRAAHTHIINRTPVIRSRLRMRDALRQRELAR